MKKQIISPLFLTISLLASCKSNNNVELKIISPSGAPSAIFYDYSLNDNFETNSTPANVGAQLQANNYDVVVFDFYNGLKSIKKNNGNYKLARILTGGNLFLVGIDKKETPSEKDYIVSFGQNLLPDLVYRKIYGEEIANATKYVNGVNEVAAVLNSGLHNGNSVDYVLIAQPALFAQMNSSKVKDKINVIDNLRDKWEEITGNKTIPQAGLFINQTTYEKNKKSLNDFLNKVDENIDACINNPQKMKDGISLIENETDQKAKFGFTANVAFNVQKDKKNGFAFVSKDEQGNLADCLSSFFSTMNISEDYSSYLMN